MIPELGQLALCLALAVALVRPLGPVGIALGSSAGAMLNFVLQVATLDRRVGGKIWNDATIADDAGRQHSLPVVGDTADDCGGALTRR